MNNTSNVQAVAAGVRTRFGSAIHQFTRFISAATAPGDVGMTVPYRDAPR